MFTFTDTQIHPLHTNSKNDLPTAFTFPFYYTPHPLCLTAAKDLQNYLENQSDFTHNFGLDDTQNGLVIGKMFGIMVVKNQLNQLFYIAAFSGKLADSNHLKGFVPPVYDTLNTAGFYKKGEAQLNQLNHTISQLETATNYISALRELERITDTSEKEIQALKTLIKTKKQQRKRQRENAQLTLNAADFSAYSESLNQKSIAYQIQLKQLKLYWANALQNAKHKVDALKAPILNLKKQRAKQSANLQKQLHEHYRFLNAYGEEKDLLGIFKTTTAGVPPAAAGECAAPKLFQFAYQNQLHPVAMAEFWWGASPKSEVRKHQQFYPSCRSKCEPILGHMMQGLTVEPNPITNSISENKALNIVFEDEHLLVVNKPHEFLSVPGKTQNTSVLSQLKQYLPNAKGPLLVHRLDMSTSGLLLVAKTERIHKQLQKQFIERSVQKRYVALLDGILKTTEGLIDLPLRVDLDNRPQQLVCYDYGKPAKTKYRVIDIENSRTRVYFYPISGRTHQLRVHAAHVNGLNTPIVGDDLYGKRANRLHLHAERISFVHPATKKQFTMQCDAPF